ncbi:MAG: hypothetical protein AAF962_07020 [Actinomycetota bacterium]
MNDEPFPPGSIPAPSSDPFDAASDDTFEDEATIPIKPRPRADPLDETDWPPRRPTAPTRHEPNAPSGSAPDRPSAPDPAPSEVGAATSAPDVLTLDNPPAVRRPWVPQRQRALDVDAIVRRRRSVGSRLLLIAVAIGIATAAGLLALRLLPT